MTRTISIITATVGAALLFAVPAWGDNWGADKARGGSPELAELLAAKNGTVDGSIVGNTSATQRMLDARERSFATVDTQQVSPLEARERALVAKHEATLSSDFYADGFAQAVQPRESAPVPVRDDRFNLDPNSTPVPVSATSSGTEIEWGQIGIGFGIGIVLALGLYLAMRYTRIRPLAH